MSAKLPVRHIEKVWGIEALPAPFISSDGRRIGEIWFEAPELLPELLVKYLFTSEALSVQVHPSDAQAMADSRGPYGKDECWLIVAAEPGARLGIGFKEPISKEAMRAAALDGTLGNLLSWHEVKVGDFFYIPANTVHAIGAGLGLIEVQQNSDVTYRLFDYGRARELHLDEGIAISNLFPYDRRQWHRTTPRSGTHILVDGPHFQVDQVEGLLPLGFKSRYQGPLLIIPLEGQIEIKNEIISHGECGVAKLISDVEFHSNNRCLLCTLKHQN